MKIILLGAAGFIGTNLVIELAQNSQNEITVVDKNKNYFKTLEDMHFPHVRSIESDLNMDSDYERLVEGQDLVYHLISTTVPTTSNQHIAEELKGNVVLSANLFEACVHQNVKKVVFFSSGGYPVGTRSNDERRCEYPEERACGKPACHKTRQASKEHRNSDHQSEYTSYDLSKSGLLADQLLEERRLAGRIPSLGLSGAVHPLSVTGICGRPVSPVRIISIGTGAALACSTPVCSAAHILTAVLFVVIPNVSLDRIGNFLYSFSDRLAQVFEIIAVYGIVDRVHYFASCLI